MRPENRIRFPRYLVRYTASETPNEVPNETPATEEDFLTEVDCITLAAPTYDTAVKSFLGELSDTGRTLRTRAEARRRRETFVTIGVFVLVTCLILLGYR